MGNYGYYMFTRLLPDHLDSTVGTYSLVRGYQRDLEKPGCCYNNLVSRVLDLINPLSKNGRSHPHDGCALFNRHLIIP